MAINLEKGQRINLEKSSGAKLARFCVGCNWGAIVTRSMFGREKVKSVDLDLSCVLVDASGSMSDFLYSPLYKEAFCRGNGMPKGKEITNDGALRHSGDDLTGDADGDDGLDNEVITVDLTRINPSVQQIFFFLNNCGSEDFSQIPYASIRMFEGTPERPGAVFAKYDVAAEAAFRGKTALIMGKLYRRGGDWKFSAIGDAYPDENLFVTIKRILQKYV